MLGIGEFSVYGDRAVEYLGSITGYVMEFLLGTEFGLLSVGNQFPFFSRPSRGTR